MTADVRLSHGHALGAAVVIADAEGRVLLVHHTYGRRNWEIPGGGTEPGESVVGTARREAREELGVAVAIERLTGVYWEPGARDGHGMHHFVFRAVLEGPLPPAPPDPREIAEWTWARLETPPRPISDFTLRRIRDGLSDEPAAVSTIGARVWLT